MPRRISAQRGCFVEEGERHEFAARLVGLEAFKWHGDVGDSRKERFRQSPAHILMTTPESLEVMMISERTDARALFEGLSAVIIDEVHAFAADDRGAHLASLLERLVLLCGRDIQRSGLSATVGNPHVIGEWLQDRAKDRFVSSLVFVENRSKAEKVAHALGGTGVEVFMVPVHRRAFG